MPAVLVHGVPDTSALWDKTRSHLSRPDVVAPSLPGFGCATPGGWEPTKEAYAAWLIDYIAAIGEPVDLVGHDWGSLLVQRVASTRPDLIRTWAAGGGAVDETYVWHDLAQMWQTPEVGEQVMEAFTYEALLAGLGDAGVPADAIPGVASHVDETMKTCILGLYRSAVNVGAEWGPALDANTKPALVIWGANDIYATPAFGERLAARIRGTLELLPDCGHFWPHERPAETAAAIEKLWASV